MLKQQTLVTLPPEWPQDLRPFIHQKVRDSGQKIIVLDDDPTGAQTVYDVPVLTDWSVAALAAELRGDDMLVFLLTNSRSLPEAEAHELYKTIGQNIAEAGQQTGHDYVVLSRSDSTLRGHFPAETEAVAAGLRQEFDATLFVPFFLEGERYTIDDVHYVAEGAYLIPAGETPFAQDKAFGYSASNLREWLVEKGNGRISPHTIHTLSITELRQQGARQVTKRLLSLPRGSVCVVNAASYRDLDVFVMGLLAAEAAGKRYLYRTAASFVRVRAGLAQRPLLTAADLHMPATGGGLIVVGSYVPQTTRQVQILLSHSQLEIVEVIVDRLLLDEQKCEEEIAVAAQLARAALLANKSVVIFTSRNLVAGQDAVSSLAIGQRVSQSLSAIVQKIDMRPRYFVAKGGITSHDLATQALGMKRARVLGQLLPGVPVWRAGAESRYPDMAYVVFPGNVGGDGALLEVVGKLEKIY